MEPVVVACDGCGARLRTAKPRQMHRRSCPRCGAALAPAFARALRERRPSASELAGRVALWLGVLLPALVVLATLAGRRERAARPAPPTAGRASATIERVASASQTSGPQPAIPDPSRTARADAPPGLPRAAATVSSPTGRLSTLPEPSKSAAPTADAPTKLPVHRTPTGPSFPLARVAGVPRPVRPAQVYVDDGSGRIVVARVHGLAGSRVAVLLPDGRIGWPDRLVPADEPFRPLDANELTARLQEGPCRGLEVIATPHYLVFYGGTRRFADTSARLLESLHRGLTDELRAKGFDVREPEFPLVAVIYPTEAEFRASKAVADDVEAYYEPLSNRIVLYEQDRLEPALSAVAALRRPRAIAHEGTHQILQNTGVHPRLAPWPAWLVEGLAECCAPTTLGPDGGWDGFGRVNPLHVATLRDLPAATTRGRPRPGEPSSLERLITRAELTPTDYALAWALVHYLNDRRPQQLLAYLRNLGQIKPCASLGPPEHLDAFLRAFAVDDFPSLESQVLRHVVALPSGGPPCYYAATFEQALPGGLIRREATVGCSPALIRQWVEALASPGTAPYRWHLFPFSSQAAAETAARSWLDGR